MSVATVRRLRLRLRGAVQGVGFRPFVYRLARRMDVTGWIANDAAGVVIEAEADDDTLARFTAALTAEAPPRAIVHETAQENIEPVGSTDFRIHSSAAGGVTSAVVLPDVATCMDCMRDVQDPVGRRAGYAFTNCTNCGPRYSIIQDLPYDRAATTMAGFTMCAACAAEYEDPDDRRFHAQPNACPVCGPSLELRDRHGDPIACVDVIAASATALRAGRVIAVKGIGGFHLMVDARNELAVAALRERKRRPSRPFAVMAASVEQARGFVHVDDAAARMLESPETPIVLLPRRFAPVMTGSHLELAAGVAPDNPFIGVMLPAAPLQHLLLAAFGAPVVATSGNLAEEPICTTDADAVQRLAGVADLFLVHDRPIERHVDDSVVHFVDGAPRLLRRARGYAPMPILLPAAVPPILAVGPQLKNSIAVSRGRQVFVSQHIGDLDALETQVAFERVTADLLRLYDVQPVAVVRDLHPDYVSTVWARAAAVRAGVPDIAVQHHHAHLVSCMAENGVTERTLGIVWDGTGYGTDGTIWGGEFLLGDAHSFERVAHLRPFRLPGGDAAVREPGRVAMALLDAAFDVGASTPYAESALEVGTAAQRETLRHMIRTGLNSPVTTSAGRLFDGIAAILGICGVSSYEGEAAMRLEYAVDLTENGAYGLPLDSMPDSLATTLDWRPMIRRVVEDHRRGVPVSVIAARVHNALADAIVLQAQLTGCPRVALSGGCFQNRVLTERAAAALRRNGFDVLLHTRVPPNDGGVALGQLVSAAARLGATDESLIDDSGAGAGVPAGG